MNGQVQLLVFSLDGRSHGLYLRQVERVVRAVDAAPLPGARGAVMGVIDLQGTLVALLSVRTKFGAENREVRVDDQFIIARTAKRRVALVVDNVSGIVQRPAAEVTATRKNVEALAEIEGVIHLDDGLVLIHDLDKFLSLDEERELEQALTELPRHGR